MSDFPDLEDPFLSDPELLRALDELKDEFDDSQLPSEYCSLFSFDDVSGAESHGVESLILSQLNVSSVQTSFSSIDPSHLLASSHLFRHFSVEKELCQLIELCSPTDVSQLTTFLSFFTENNKSTSNNQSVEWNTSESSPLYWKYFQLNENNLLKFLSILSLTVSKQETNESHYRITLYHPTHHISYPLLSLIQSDLYQLLCYNSHLFDFNTIFICYSTNFIESLELIKEQFIDYSSLNHQQRVNLLNQHWKWRDMKFIPIKINKNQQEKVNENQLKYECSYHLVWDQMEDEQSVPILYYPSPSDWNDSHYDYLEQQFPCTNNLKHSKGEWWKRFYYIAHRIPIFYYTKYILETIYTDSSSSFFYWSSSLTESLFVQLTKFPAIEQLFPPGRMEEFLIVQQNWMKEQNQRQGNEKFQQEYESWKQSNGKENSDEALYPFGFLGRLASEQVIIDESACNQRLQAVLKGNL
jgi:hypothetical protein